MSAAGNFGSDTSTSQQPTYSVADIPMGAPADNRNAITSGIRSFLTTGRYPKGCSYVAKCVGQLRLALMDAVRQKHGEVSLWHAATIQTCCRHEGRSMLWHRWLKLEATTMTVEQRLSVVRDICMASDARDRCLKALGLDKGNAVDHESNIYRDLPPLNDYPLDPASDEPAALPAVPGGEHVTNTGSGNAYTGDVATVEASQ